MKKLMTWLLFALGVLLMALGTAFLYSGFGLIEIERGAAQVSAGASLLAGGAVTLGFSVILMQMQEALAHLVDHTPMSADDIAAQTKASLPLMAAGGMAGAGAAVAASVAGLSKLAEHQPDADQPAGDDIKPEPEATVPAPAPPSEPLHIEKPEEPVAPVVPEPAAAPPLAPPPHDAAPATPASATPSEPPRSPLTLVEPTPSSDQAADDWFERMFAETPSTPTLTAVPKEIDESHAAQQPAPAPAVKAPEVSIAPPHPEPAPPHAEPEAHVAPTMVAPITEPRPEPHAETHLPSDEVVARHEADGITYIMYADGSIEANDGVTSRRFASMDELAASIQG